MLDLTLRHLKAFIAVARCGSLKNAAAELKLSQPAISMTLSDLETQLGTKLFDRSGRVLMANSQARRLMPLAMNALAQIDEIKDQFGQPERSIAGQLQIGASSTIANYLLPRVITEFVRQYADIRISLSVGNTAQVITQLQDFRVDIGFVEGVCHTHELERLAWREDELFLFAATSHPLAKKKLVKPADLERATWIMREPGSGTREVFENAAAGQIRNLNIALEFGHSEAVKRAVREGLGIGCLSRLAIEQELADSVFKRLVAPCLRLDRQLQIVIHKKKYQSALLRAFLNFCRL